jgi:N-acyl-D-aspartate/D-glutamate deacylase
MEYDVIIRGGAVVDGARLPRFRADERCCVQRAEGYRYALVNGEVTFEDGRCTGATPGRLLRNRQVDGGAFAATAE